MPLSPRLKKEMQRALRGITVAVLNQQPPNVREFAVVYFSRLLKFKAENPCLNDDEVLQKFHMTEVNGLPMCPPELKTAAVQTSVDEEPSESFSSEPPRKV
ncbi:calcium-binding tyrosine phosphorylation-regulated protein-like [Protopterus annectens]|uniref:calcium-binding tyrosine phosphorylation-regulated protein-like n=1 Tax=Protopterus annectens TaxID=7888 RepID=UPI001CFB726B|nr:calcium-binding tyrosine phosphorylation-regulated protein-like [Protopterus annectens]XP_043925614.1 calcium-binding tyrosine phosphorylation-regulated protein-like [Protopterus annectens]